VPPPTALRIELRQAGIAVALIEPSSVKTADLAEGRDSKAELLAALPPEALDAYGDQIESVYAATEGEEPRRDAGRARQPTRSPTR